MSRQKEWGYYYFTNAMSKEAARHQLNSFLETGMVVHVYGNTTRKLVLPSRTNTILSLNQN